MFVKTTIPSFSDIYSYTGLNQWIGTNRLIGSIFYTLVTVTFRPWFYLYYGPIGMKNSLSSFGFLNNNSLPHRYITNTNSWIISGIFLFTLYGVYTLSTQNRWLFFDHRMIILLFIPLWIIIQSKLLELSYHIEKIPWFFDEIVIVRFIGILHLIHLIWMKSKRMQIFPIDPCQKGTIWVEGPHFF